MPEIRFERKTTEGRRWVRLGGVAFVEGVVTNTLEDGLPFRVSRWHEIAPSLYMGFIDE